MNARLFWTFAGSALALGACTSGGTGQSASNNVAPAIAGTSTENNAQALVAHEFADTGQLRTFLDENVEKDLQDRFTVADGILRVAIVPSDADFSMGNISEHPVVLEKGIEEATLEYRFRFSPQFDFVKQGKLPGISSRVPHFGGNKNDPVAPNSWSYRHMWLKLSNDTSARPDMYIYDQFRALGQTGEHYRPAKGTEFIPGQWYVTRMYMKLNTKDGTGKARLDGTAELWRDTQPLVCNEGLMFRGDNYTDDSKITRIAYHFYHGGPRRPVELPSRADGQWIEFDYIRLWEGRQTPMAASGQFLQCDLPPPPKPDYR